jgi:hypothetical protein
MGYRSLGHWEIEDKYMTITQLRPCIETGSRYSLQLGFLGQI